MPKLPPSVYAPELVGGDRALSVCGWAEAGLWQRLHRAMLYRLGEGGDRLLRRSGLAPAHCGGDAPVWTEGGRYLGLDVLTRCRIRPDTAEEVTDQPTVPALRA